MVAFFCAHNLTRFFVHNDLCCFFIFLSVPIENKKHEFNFGFTEIKEYPSNVSKIITEELF